MNVKDLGKVAEKFATVTPQRSQQYVDGVLNSPVDWAKATAASEGTYEAGVQKAISRKAFGKGVTAAGNQKMKDRVSVHGASRFQAGVATAGPAYEAGFKPYHEVLKRVVLPPRRPRRDPGNLARVQAVTTALGKEKESRG